MADDTLLHTSSHRHNFHLFLSRRDKNSLAELQKKGSETPAAAAAAAAAAGVSKLLKASQSFSELLMFGFSPFPTSTKVSWRTGCE